MPEPLNLLSRLRRRRAVVNHHIRSLSLLLQTRLHRLPQPASCSRDQPRRAARAARTSHGASTNRIVSQYASQPALYNTGASSTAAEKRPRRRNRSSRRARSASISGCVRLSRNASSHGPAGGGAKTRSATAPRSTLRPRTHSSPHPVCSADSLLPAEPPSAARFSRRPLARRTATRHAVAKHGPTPAPIEGQLDLQQSQDRMPEAIRIENRGPQRPSSRVTNDFPAAMPPVTPITTMAVAIVSRKFLSDVAPRGCPTSHPALRIGRFKPSARTEPNSPRL